MLKKVSLGSLDLSTYSAKTATKQFSCTALPGWQSFTSNNFLPMITEFSGNGANGADWSGGTMESISGSYANGIYTLSVRLRPNNGGSITGTAVVYCVYKE